LTQGDAFPRAEFAHTAGEDNEAVLGELLGMSTKAITELKERDVLR
jgi:hypothetical protein